VVYSVKSEEKVMEFIISLLLLAFLNGRKIDAKEHEMTETQKDINDIMWFT